MGVTDVFGKLLKREPAEGTNYLSLTLTSDKILASIWRLENSSEINVVGFSEKDFHSVDSLIHEAAVAIDSAAKNINSDVSQVVFGLSNYWFENGTLAKETIDILKNLAQELELDAQAFVPLVASVGHYLKLKGEGQNATLIGAFGDYTEVSLVKAGGAVSKEHKGKASVDDVAALITRLKDEPGQTLPKLAIFFGENSQHIKKELEKEKNPSVFEEGTKLEALTNEELAKCIVYSQAADVLGREPQLAAGQIVSADAAPNQQKDEAKEPEAEEEKVVDQETGKGDEFEFKEGVDVLEQPAQVSKGSGEISQKPEKVEETRAASSDYAVEVTERGNHYETPAQKLQESSFSRKKSMFDALITLNWLSIIFKGNSKKKLLVSALLLVVASAAIVYILGYTITNAQVLIKANSKPFEDNFDITVASGAALDTARSRIPGEETSAIVSESSQAQTTGVKKTGNNSKGEVKVFNWTTSKVSFDKGTVLISKNGIKFELDSGVEVASRSASSPGESTVGVTADEFGASGNVAAGTEFTFQQHDELLYSAKNDNAMTGGDEKEIKVVAKKDQDDLAEALEGLLTQKAKSELQQKVGGQSIADEAIEVIVVRKQFSANIEEEASALTLNMEVEASALSYKEETLKEFLAKATQEQAEGSLESRPENVDILEIDVTRGKGTLNLEGKYRSNLVPKIDEDNLKTAIAGKGQKKAREIVKQNPEISEVEFTFSPNLILFSNVPKNKDRISVKVEAIK